jgi:hypothetical protein
MTAQQEATMALDLYQSNKDKGREVLESILEHFFSYPSLSEYEATQEAVAREFVCVSTETSTSQF